MRWDFLKEIKHYLKVKAAALQTSKGSVHHRAGDQQRGAFLGFNSRFKKPQKTFYSVITNTRREKKSAMTLMKQLLQFISAGRIMVS